MSLLNRGWRVIRFAISGGLGRKGVRKLSSLISVFEKELEISLVTYLLHIWLFDASFADKNGGFFFLL